MCFTGDIVDDMVGAEFNETFMLRITNVSPTDVQIGLRETTITIVDNDGKDQHCSLDSLLSVFTIMNMVHKIWLEVMLIKALTSLLRASCVNLVATLST